MVGFQTNFYLFALASIFVPFNEDSTMSILQFFEDLLAESGKDSSEIRLQACDKSRNGREARSVIFHEINDAQIHLASDLPIA